MDGYTMRVSASELQADQEFVSGDCLYVVVTVDEVSGTVVGIEPDSGQTEEFFPDDQVFIEPDQRW